MSEPISVAEVEAQVRFDLSNETDKVKLFISAIRESGEAATRRALLITEEVLNLSAFPGALPIELKKPPLRSVDSITYIDIDGVEQTLIEDTDFRVIFNTEKPVQPSCIAPMYGEAWPTARNDYNSVVITYTCGYGSIEGANVPVPTALKQWMLLNIANLYEHRETIQVDNRLMMIEIPTIADMLLADYKVSGW